MSVLWGLTTTGCAESGDGGRHLMRSRRCRRQCLRIVSDLDAEFDGRHRVRWGCRHGNGFVWQACLFKRP